MSSHRLQVNFGSSAPQDVRSQQQRGQLLLCRRKRSGSFGAVFAGGSGNGTADASHPHLFLGVTQPGNRGFGFSLCILRQSAAVCRRMATVRNAC